MEAPITPICKPALIAILLAATPAAAADSPLASYARARVAQGDGAHGAALREYGSLLASAPDELLALRAYEQAMDAGDRVLALRAARLLGAGQEEAAPEVRLLLLGEAVRKSEWKAASAQSALLRKDGVFGFMAPILDAWIAVGSRKGDAMAALQGALDDPMTRSYAAEHKPLILLASGRREKGVEALRALGDNGRSQRLRIAGASLLARKGDRDEALALLAGDDPAFAAAREAIGRRESPGRAIATPADGMAELVLRLAGDLYRQQVKDLAIRFGRIATFVAPANAEAWLLTAEMLGNEGQSAAAIAALGQVRADDPQAPLAASMKTRFLLAEERGEEALGLALASASAPDAGVQQWVTLGDAYTSLDRHPEAAEAYGRALEARGEESAVPEWMLRLMKGGALETAGRWREAKAELEAAYRLAPDQALVLNYLGYAQLERRENVEEATKLVAEASRLDPDSAEITDSLGWAHFLAGDMPKAIELLERAAQGRADDPEINEHLGDAYYHAGRRYEARYAWQAALLQAQGGDAERIRAKIEAGWTPALASP